MRGRVSAMVRELAPLMKIPCLQCFGFVDEHEGGVCPGRPADAAEYADRHLRRQLPAVWEAKRVLFELFPKLRP